MFIDLRECDGPANIDADVCIVGAGAAGITLALELVGTGCDVCVLESGTLDYDADTQSLAGGENIGLPYHELIASRLRFLGGTTNHWAGICRPLDALDFEQRDAVPHSGWPITRADLDGYYERAHQYCRLGPYRYDPEFWATPEAPLLRLAGGPFGTSIKLQRAVRFGREYRDRLQASQGIRVYLAANATDIEAATNGNVISRVHAQTLEHQSIRVSAKIVVVAAGAIENARLLLSSNQVHRNGLGNTFDLVGRYFMEHPLVPSMEMQLASTDKNLALYTGQDRDGLGVTGYFTLAAQTQRREGMLNACAFLTIGGANRRIAKSRNGIASALAIWNSLIGGEMPPDFGTHVGNLLADLNHVVIYSYERAFERTPDAAGLVVELEQAPNPSSRVTPADEADRLGMRRVHLDWQMGELERHTIRRFGELLGLEAGRTGLGRIRLLEPDEDGWWAGLQGAWHHMGTTRMHSDPRQGVVDADCRVHGIDNLYIAGSSVFTTSGFANPTLTIVALAIRLADRLKGLPS